MIAIVCPCGRQLQVDDSHAGRAVRCPFCGIVLEAPAAWPRATQPVAQFGETPRISGQVHSTSSSHGSLNPGQKFGHYTIRHKLGAGAMGEVWLALDSALDRPLAIKIMPPALGADEERLLRFFREARLAAKLNHPHVVTIYQVGVEEGLPFLAMEYVDGGSLEQGVLDRGPLDWRRATQVVRDAAAGLAQAHALGLVHRDIKPANLLCTSQRMTKVADFGLARASNADSSLTREGASLGTPAYMSPEQWKGEPADARSDLYSLVCTYYFLLTGQPPFSADSAPALGYLHTHEPFPVASRLRPDLPQAVDAILEHGSRKSANARYQTAGELIAALDALLVAPQTARAAEPSMPVIVAAAAPRRAARKSTVRISRWHVASAALTLLLAIAGGSAFLWYTMQSSPESAAQVEKGVNGTGGQRAIPSDAAYFAGNAYKFFPEQLAWQDAKARCEALGGHLVVIDHANENQFVADLVSRAGWQDCWIGFTDEASEGQWRTVLGQPLSYTNWFRNQPNNKQQQEHYALISNRTLVGNPLGWTWSDQPNQSVQHQPGYACEWEKPGSAFSAAMTGDFAVTSAGLVPPDEWQAVELTGNAALLSTHGWSIGSNLIVCATSQSGYLRTRRDYYNFILELEYQLPPAANSGILVRARDVSLENNGFMEVQLLADTDVFPPESRTGGIHGAVAPKASPVWPAEKWNSLKVHCEGEKVAVWINDIEVVDVQMFQIPLLANRPRSGFIALYNWQGRANGAMFRNIRIKELK